MSNFVTARSQAIMPAQANANSGPARDISAQTRNADSLADAALAKVVGPDVSGGGAPGPDTRDGIPTFVRQFLPRRGATLPAGVQDAAEGVAAGNEAPTKKGAARGREPGNVAKRGWTWLGCRPGQGPSQSPPPPIPPMKGEESAPTAPPLKGEQVSVPHPAEVEDNEGNEGPYTVQKGDYLSKIAPRYGITWQQLYWANRDEIKHPDLIHPGQVLKIPSDDLVVPDFPYSPMFPGGHSTPDSPTAPGKTPPGKTPPIQTAPDKTPPGKTPPIQTAPGKTPPGKTPPGKTPPPSGPPTDSKTPPSSPPESSKPGRDSPGRNPGGQLPPPPPVPRGTRLPPPLPPM